MTTPTARAETYAFARPVPFLVEREYPTLLQAPIRRTSDGAIVAVTETGSTCEITDPSGTTIAGPAAVAVSSSIAAYAVTLAVGSALGEGFTTIWRLVIGGETYTFRWAAICCEYVPPNCITAADLYGGEGISELRYHIPQAQQADRGDGTLWGPQIDAAYYAFVRRLLNDSRPIWRLRDASGYREYLLALALQNAVETVPAADGTPWGQYRKDAFHKVGRAEAALRCQYDTEKANVRRGASPVIRLGPGVARPPWA